MDFISLAETQATEESYRLRKNRPYFGQSVEELDFGVDALHYSDAIAARGSSLLK
jgi:hypothetical protein